MQYDAESPKACLAMLDVDWRRDRLFAIREMMLDVPGIEERNSYKMLAYHRFGVTFGHLNAQKGFVGVYLGDLERIDPGGTILGRADCGKSCLRVRRTDGLDVAMRLIKAKCGLVLK